MEMRDEQERFREGVIPRDFVIYIGETILDFQEDDED